MFHLLLRVIQVSTILNFVSHSFVLILFYSSLLLLFHREMEKGVRVLYFLMKLLYKIKYLPFCLVKEKEEKVDFVVDFEQIVSFLLSHHVT